jgi:hypothetical protein
MNIEKIRSYLDTYIIPNDTLYKSKKTVYCAKIKNKIESEEINEFTSKYRFFIQQDDEMKKFLHDLGRDPAPTPILISKNDEDEKTVTTTSSSEPYMFYVWDKMLKLCDIIDPSDKDTDTVVQSDNSRNESRNESGNESQQDSLLGLLEKVIDIKMNIAKEETSKQMHKLRERINFVMSSLTYDLIRIRYEAFNNYDLSKNATFSNVFTEEGIDVYDFKELTQCFTAECNDVDTFLREQYETVMKGSKYKHKVLINKQPNTKQPNTKQLNTKQPNTVSTLRLRQKPYIESFSSYKLQKDINSNKLEIQGLKRNVRISSDITNNSVISKATSKKAWYLLKHVNDILTQVQVFFTYVKEIFANTTIRIRNHLDTIYTPEQLLIVSKIKKGEGVKEPEMYSLFKKESNLREVPMSDLEKMITKELSEFNRTIYSPLCARIYSISNDFLTKLIEASDITKNDIIRFKTKLASIKEEVIGTKQGGGLFGSIKKGYHALTNICIVTIDTTMQIVSLLQVSLANVMRYLNEMNPIMARLLTSIITIASCGLTAASFISGNILMGMGMARYCALGVYLAYFSFRSDGDKIKTIQDKLGSALGTTSVIVMIMKYGGFKSLHDMLLEKIKKIIDEGSLDEKTFTTMQSDIEKGILTIQKESNDEELLEELTEQNMYIFHRKLLDVIIKATQQIPATKEALMYFIKNTPKDANELRKIIDLMIGDVSINNSFFPATFSIEQKNEFNNYLTRTIANPDLRKYILLCILKKYNEKEQRTTPTSSILENNDIKSFLQWMKGEYENKDMKISACKQIESFMESCDTSIRPETTQSKSGSLRSIINQLTLIEKFNDNLPLNTVILNTVYEKAIDNIYEKYKTKSGITLYKNVLEDITYFIVKLDYKFKHPSYTIFMFDEDTIKGFFSAAADHITKKEDDKEQEIDNKQDDIQQNFVLPQMYDVKRFTQSTIIETTSLMLISLGIMSV